MVILIIPNTNFIQALGSILLMIITGIYVYLTYCILKDNEKNSYDTNRPYIALYHVFDTSAGMGPAIYLKIKNEGKTPAKIQTFSYKKIPLEPHPWNERKLPAEEYSAFENTSIFPSQEFSNNISFQGYQSQVNWRIEVTVCYSPAVNKRKVHKTVSFFLYNPSGRDYVFKLENTNMT